MKQSFYLSLLASAVLTGCATVPAPQKFELQDSYLRSTGADVVVERPVIESDTATRAQQGLLRVPVLRGPVVGFTSDVTIADQFSSGSSLQIAADNMPLPDFLHHVFGDLLKANYILGEGLSNDSGTISLNVQEALSQRKLYNLTEQLLLQRGIVVKRQNDVLYIQKQPKDGPDVTSVGYGRTPDSVPSSINVQQIVPLRYVFNGNIVKTLKEVANVKTTVDMDQGVVFISGDREQVIRALELMQLLDAPGSRSRHVGFLKLAYIPPKEFIESLTQILINEGIMRGPNVADNRVSFVPVAQLGAVAVFASEQDFLNRIEFWAGQLDKPSKGTEKQYFIYAPRYARASDLGQSVSVLITGQSGAVQSRAQSSTEQRTAEVENRNAQTTTGASGDNVKMVVDERSNTLIFYTSGSDYQALLPLIERLDVMPKQVMLELTIAEVTLTDEFKYGVDAAFNSGRFSGSTSFGAADIGGAVLGWASGSKTINAQAFETNSLVNVLSKPTILVRDGVAATINVGTDIPIVGKTTTDPTNGTTRSVDYRKTGIDVSVTPTINAQGVVIMSIDQSNSNQVAGGATLEGNPQIFERSLKTEVVAESGQTIVLGGLISEDKSNNDDGVPFLHRLPLVGALFGTKTRTTNKTELVILVTPRVIHQADEWTELKEQLNESMQFIRLDQ
ncbi:secretin N-terminal domain-containing protein [Rheinheimera sp.]|uniref:secretin N-terminal domain-containing protein n=1 Tax=Rheinheimera sp. TaxID=1869214 RepID=UPI00307E0263